jgi:hypothetical protein
MRAWLAALHTSTPARNSSGPPRRTVTTTRNTRRVSEPGHGLPGILSRAVPARRPLVASIAVMLALTAGVRVADAVVAYFGCDELGAVASSGRALAFTGMSSLELAVLGSAFGGVGALVVRWSQRRRDAHP